MDPQEGAHLRRSLTERGVIVMKEIRSIAHISNFSGSPLEISGVILVTFKGDERRVHAGIKFEQAESTDRLGSAAFIDLDEVDELLASVTYIRNVAGQMANQLRDYTEVTYSTRDDLTVGFYQQGPDQRGFVRLGTGARAVAFESAALASVEEAVMRAKSHVSERRTAWETAR